MAGVRVTATRTSRKTLMRRPTPPWAARQEIVSQPWSASRRTTSPAASGDAPVSTMACSSSPVLRRYCAGSVPAHVGWPVRSKGPQRGRASMLGKAGACPAMAVPLPDSEPRLVAPSRQGSTRLIPRPVGRNARLCPWEAASLVATSPPSLCGLDRLNRRCHPSAGIAGIRG